MADQQSVQVSYDSATGELKAEPDRLKILKAKKDITIVWTPGFGVRSVDNVDFGADEGPDKEFSGKQKNSPDGTVSIKDKNSEKKVYKYSVEATKNDGHQAPKLDPFVENDPKK